MCGAPKSPRVAAPAADPANLVLDNTQRRRTRRLGPDAPGVGRSSLRIDLNVPAAGGATGLRIPLPTS